jgi:hypothetical protein
MPTIRFLLLLVVVSAPPWSLGPSILDVLPFLSTLPFLFISYGFFKTFFKSLIYSVFLFLSFLFYFVVLSFCFSFWMFIRICRLLRYLLQFIGVLIVGICIIRCLGDYKTVSHPDDKLSYIYSRPLHSGLKYVFYQ